MRAEYVREGVPCYVDRSRGYLVPATPEEQVRQDTLDWLIDKHNVPAQLVRSEFHTARRGGIGRVDILVLAPGSTDYDAVLVVECKRPDAFLDMKAEEQATTYAKTVGATYVIVTNGDERIALAESGGRWGRLAKVPSWREMLAKRGLRWAAERDYVRDPWSAIDVGIRCTDRV
jgi:hypothetical protein